MADPGVQVVAETERLIFRHELPGDLEIWLEHMNTPAVMEKVGGVQPRENIVESFARMAAPGDDEPSFYFLALKSDGTLIGKCGLSSIETAVAPGELRGAVQVGWTLRADHWGHGYATEAATAMLATAFELFHLPIVYSQTSERNRGSWRVMQRVGMKRLAELDYDDPEYPPEDNPTMVWGLTREAWASHCEAGAADA